MKILILSDDFPPQSFGGAGFSTFYLALGLYGAGHQVFIVTTCREKSLEGNTDCQGLKVSKIYTDYHRRWRAYLSLYNPQTAGKVRKLIEEISPDIIHAHNIHYYLSYHCLKIAKKAKKPVFWTARDAMSFAFGKLATKKYLERFDCKTNFFDHLKQARKRYNPLRNFFIKKYLKYPDKIFAVSYALKEALQANGISNIEVNHTGIDVADWQINPERVEEFRKKYNLEGKKTIFFGGRISGYKGLDQINQALVRVKEEIPETVLLVAGGKEIGWLTGDELKAAYYASDIVVVPSVVFDPFPRSNLEAMACRKPVVATSYGGSSEIVQDGITGCIVNPFNVELMAEKIIDLLKNPDKARQFGEAGFERVKKHFSLKTHVDKTLAYYDRFKQK